MAKSKYEYVKKFELNDALLPNTYIVIRIDGRSFSQFTQEYRFQKPNDAGGVRLMNECARQVMLAMPDVQLAYGQSDEYSFLLDRKCQLYQRRASKLVSAVVSIFTGNYVRRWDEFMPVPMRSEALPSFDGRAVCYPSLENVRDYFAWRQADCHINNLYNTCFWALVQRGGQSEVEAEATLCKTVSGEKNELLFSRFGMNYNNEPAMFKKGSAVVRTKVEQKCVSAKTGEEAVRMRPDVVVEHCDLISDDAFWHQRVKLST